MKAQLSAFCFFSLCLQGADSCYQEGAMDQFRAAGENFSFSCVHHFPETWKIFCRDDCEGENVLIKTQADSAQSGRFSSEHQFDRILHVSISPMTKADSGTYHCGTGASVSAASFTHFQLRVTDAVLDKRSGPQQSRGSAEPGSSITVACLFAFSGGTKYLCRGDCGGNAVVQTAAGSTHSGRYNMQYERKSSAEGPITDPSPSELTQSDSGRYRCQQDGPGTAFIDFGITVTLDVPVVVGATLAALVVLFSAALLVSCRRRSLRGLMTSGGLNASVAETLTYENCCPEDPEEDPEDPEEDPEDPEEDPTYQSLNPSSQDQNQIYSELDPKEKLDLSSLLTDDIKRQTNI